MTAPAPRRPRPAGATTSAAAALLFATLAAAAPAGATLYSFVDENGVTHFSNLPSDARYRKVPGTTPPRRPPDAAAGESVAAERYQSEIEQCAEDHGVDEALVKAVIKAESNYDNRAISRAGAQGLMQLMPGTARLRNVDNPFNPTENIDGGVRHLKHLLSTFGDTELALAAYNAGENAVRRYNGVPPYPETQNYVSTVLSHYDRYSGRTPRDGAVAKPAPPAKAEIVTFVNPEGTRVYTNEPWRYPASQGWRREPPP